MNKRNIFLALSVLLLAACVKDDLWQEHYQKAYLAGEDIGVSADSIATVARETRAAESDGWMVPMPGYLTVVSSHYFSSDHGDYIFRQRSGVEAMHNVHANVKVVEGDPADIQSLVCTIDGLASRYDIPQARLLGPSAATRNTVTMAGTEGHANYRLLGAIAEQQMLTLHLLTTGGQEYEVEMDASLVMKTLSPTPFEVAEESSTFTNLETGISSEVQVQIETSINVNVNIDIEIHLPDPNHPEATFTAAITNWAVNEEDINVY